MKLFIGSVTLILSMILLCGCLGVDFSVRRESEATSEREVSIHTFSSLPPESDSVPETLPPEPVVTFPTTDAEPVMATVTDPEPEFTEKFELPQEFYERMAEIIERYELNLNCGGTEACLCKPEYEVVDEEGNVLEPREKVLSVYLYDINSGFEYALNIGAHYPIASTVKIPFCTLIYEKISAGEIDPEELRIYEERHYFEGTGIIVEGEFGQEFTVRQLLELAITRSDNVAYEMLKDLITWDEFSEYLASKGCTHPEDLRRSKQKICTESAGAYGRILAGYLRTEDEYAELFKADLQNTRNRMITSSYPMYRKYGWAGFSFHDIAYIDAPRPYILAVMSNLTGEDPNDYMLFREISELVEEFTQIEFSGE